MSAIVYPRYVTNASGQRISLSTLFKTTVGYAKTAGSIMLAYRTSKKNLDIKLKHGKITDTIPDLVTAADTEIQEEVVSKIRANFPDHMIIAEEGHNQKQLLGRRSPFMWVVDPLDGTVAFSRGYTVYCFGISFLFKGYPLFAVVNAPQYDLDGTGASLFTAFYSWKGARLNDKPIHTNEKIENKKGTGIVHYLDSDIIPLPSAHFCQGLLKTFGGVTFARDLKSTILAVAQLAAGAQLDTGEFFTHPRPRVWDIVSAAFIVEKAGGMVTDYQGQSIFPVDVNKFNYIKEDDPRLPAMLAATKRAGRAFLDIVAQTSWYGR